MGRKRGRPEHGRPYDDPLLFSWTEGSSQFEWPSDSSARALSSRFEPSTRRWRPQALRIENGMLNLNQVAMDHWTIAGHGFAVRGWQVILWRPVRLANTD